MRLWMFGSDVESGEERQNIIGYGLSVLHNLRYKLRSFDI